MCQLVKTVIFSGRTSATAKSLYLKRLMDNRTSCPYKGPPFPTVQPLTPI
uniref:Uncharacterized protein n=1 Tax=Anguilla anguilla TaxID=7936 RepID=A0A0E9VA03_ANGAN